MTGMPGLGMPGMGIPPNMGMPGMGMPGMGMQPNMGIPDMNIPRNMPGMGMPMAPPSNQFATSAPPQAGSGRAAGPGPGVSLQENKGASFNIVAQPDKKVEGQMEFAELFNLANEKISDRNIEKQKPTFEYNPDPYRGPSAYESPQFSSDPFP